MKKLVLSLFLMTAAAGLSAQVGNQVNFINQLGDKKTATFQDAVTVYVLTLNKPSRGFKADVQTLKDLKILKNETYEADKTLRRGILARMVARHLQLNDSLFYRIFGTERYAYRACIAGRIMEADGSEWDRLSGEELLEVMSNVENRMEVTK